MYWCEDLATSVVVWPNSACEFCWFSLVEFTGGPRTEAKRRPYVTFRLISAERTISVFVDQVLRRNAPNSPRISSECQIEEMEFPLFSLSRTFLAKSKMRRGLCGSVTARRLVASRTNALWHPPQHALRRSLTTNSPGATYP
jgi:hypothetical protein